MKECNKCKEILPIDNFYKHKKSKDGYNWSCIKCCNGISKNYYKNNILKIKDSHYKNSYNISLEKYIEMYKECAGKCNICSRQFSVLCIDHNHITGKIRGLLCSNCNKGIGFLQTDVGINFLELAADYLKS